MTKSTNAYFNVEVKALGESEGNFSGILSTYSNIDEVGDICVEGCFEESLKKRGLQRPLLWQHSDSDPIGNFVVTDSKTALKVDGSFNLDTQRGREGYSLLKRGDINGLSIGYLVNDYSYDKDGIRLLKKVDLLEGSFVTFPANTKAAAQAKALNERKTGIVKKLVQVKAIKQMEESERNGVIEELYDLITSLMDTEEPVPEEPVDGKVCSDKPKKADDAEPEDDLELMKSIILEKTKELKKIRGST